MSHSPPSSPESSHVTTVYSQGPPSQTFARGPPSQNTRSSVMNRTRPSTTPPDSYRTALLHIQQRESNERLSNEPTPPSNTRSPSIHSTPSSPVPLSQLDALPLVPLSPFVPIRHSSPSPSSSFQQPVDHHRTQQLASSPHSQSIHHSSPASQDHSENARRWSSSISMTPSQSRYKLMQEHMDTMHSDIASLGHKHDFAMTRMGVLNDNIGCIDNNITSMKSLILTIADKITKIEPQTHSIRQPQLVPSNVPTDVPLVNPPIVAPDLHPSSLPSLRPSQIPNRVPTHNLHTLSQASSFTSIPQLTVQHHRAIVRESFPHSARPNSARNLPEHNLDSDLSLDSEKEPAQHVPSSVPSPITGRENSRQVRVSDSQISATHDSRNFPTSHFDQIDKRVSQTNTPVINNSNIHPIEPKSQFNSNYFLLLLDEIPKIKYSAIEGSLSKRCLDDDTNQSLQKLYESIIRSLNIGFSTTLHFLPSFEEINANLSFDKNFLHGLIGSNYDKAKTIYLQLGQLIKDRLTDNECISKSKSPKAYLIIHAYIRIDGWQLLETLFKRRLVNCGALADNDLDSIRVNLMMQSNESVHSFFLRTQDLANEYTMQMSRHPHLIPHFKLVRRFVSELMRAREYQPYVMDYHKLIIRHVKQNGEHTTTPVPFTLHDVYDELSAFAVAPIPSKLEPSPNLLVTTNDINDNLLPHLESTGHLPSSDIQPHIAYTAIDYCQSSDTDPDQLSPIIAAAMRNVRSKKFCQACMTIGHDADRCFLRGINFRPKELTQRINIYNQQNGDKPPAGTVMPIWNPRSPPPMLDKSSHQSNQKSSSKSKPTRPFTNAVTKSSGKSNATVNFINGHQDIPSVNEVDQSDYSPSLSTFIASQQLYDIHADDNVFDDDDSIQDSRPLISMMSIVQSTANITSTPFDFSHNNLRTVKVFKSTPTSIINKIEKVHKDRRNIPSPAFFRNFCKGLSSIDIASFQPHCKLSLQVDSGANVNAITDPNILAFYIPTRTNVEAVNGASFTSIGWGGLLIQLLPNAPPTMCCPVYVCPQNPRNTFSLGAMKLYSDFKRAIADTHIGVDLISNTNEKHHLPVRTFNGLDFIDLQVMSFKSTNPVPSLNNAVMHAITSHEQPTHFIFDQSTMVHIASYYVHLHEYSSPRLKAIRTMNALLNAKYSPPLQSSMSTLEAINDPPQVPITIFDNQSQNTYIMPVMGKLFRSVLIKKQQPIQSYMVLHLLLQHSSKSTIMKMIHSKSLADLPDLSKLKDFNCSCAICNLTKATNIPRGKLVDVTKLPPFQRLHVDFSFFGVTSLRGYTTALDIACGSTSYPFGFPTKSKTPPLVLFEWFVKTIRTMGYEVTFVRVDEDKGLARSSEFCALVVKLNCVLETTGGGNSTNNGKVERQNRTKADMVRSALATGQILFGSDLPSDMSIETFWCFAYQHACYTHRVLYNRLRNASTYTLVHNDVPSVNRLAIWGSLTTAIAPNKNSLPKLSSSRSSQVNFLGFGNNTSNIIYWDHRQPKKWYRCHHAVIDQVSTFQKLQHIFSTTSETDDLPPDTQSLKTINLPFSDGPFPANEITTVTFKVPSLHSPIGLCINDDTLFNMPYISSCHKNSVAWNNLPAKFRRHAFILNINGEGPITAAFAVSLLKQVQQSPHLTLQMDLVKRKHDPSTPLSITRAMFDQLPSLLQNRPVISNATVDTYGTHDHFITSPTKPTKPKSFFQCLKSPFRQNWIAAARLSFEKNRKVGVFSLPFPKSQLPPDTNVFRTLLVPDFKPTDIPNVYKCKVRDCTVGTNQVKGIDFPESYCAVVDATTLRLMLCVSASLGYTIGLIDVENAFQTSIAPEEYRIFVTIPVLYLQWLKETEDFSYDDKETYVRQMFNANQGTKAASHIWYWLLVPILSKYGFHRSTVDHALLIKAHEDGSYFYVCLATDDLLCAFLKYAHFDDLVKYLRRFFNLTVQTGHVLSFLSLRIIQTDLAISVDQGEYIYDLLLKYYGQSVDRIKTVTTPMRSDSAYEKELFESPPLVGNELVQSAIEYKGSYRYHTGKFQYAVTYTRFDLGFSLQRLAEYNNAPTAASFEGIGRHYRYLASDVIRPLTYPRNSMSGKTTIAYFVSPEKHIKMHLPNDLQLFTDSEFARNMSDRRSYYCIIFVLLNVAIQCKVKKSTTIAGHTTDAEMKGTYSGVRRLLPLRRILESMGFPCATPTPLYVDNAAVSAIIDAKRMTPRCRHMDIPIAYLHEQHGKSFNHELISTVKMLADLGTKPLVLALHRRFKYWACGHMFLPPEGSDHYDYLQLQFYEQSFVTIVQAFQK